MSVRDLSHEEYRKYANRHDKLRNWLGSAKRQICVHCDGQARDWATIHGRDGLDLDNDYMPLCGKCHATYDERGKVVSAKLTGRPKVPMSDEAKRKKSEAQRKYWYSKTAEERSAEASKRRWGKELP